MGSGVRVGRLGVTALVCRVQCDHREGIPFGMHTWIAFGDEGVSVHPGQLDTGSFACAMFFVVAKSVREKPHCRGTK